MYPPLQNQDKYEVDGHPGTVPDSGLPQPYPLTQPSYHPTPQYIGVRAPAAGVASSRWSSGLCHCCDDPANCLITCFCPCVTFGQIAEIVGQGSPSCAEHGTMYGLLAMTGFACFYSCFYRSKLRGQYDLEESPCADCLVHFFCEGCALCQEYRELKNRGFDMGIGWEANMTRQRRTVTVAPTVGTGMTR